MSNVDDVTKAVDTLMPVYRDRSPVIDFALYPFEITKTISEALCKSLMEVSVDKVTFRHASEKIKRDFMLAHFLNHAKFTVHYI